MNWLFTINPNRAFLLFIILDIICTGVGMGVPIFCIFLGFPIGWYIARFVILKKDEIKQLFRTVLLYSLVTSSFTFLVMALIWGRCSIMLFDPGADFINFGIPLIFYDPKASFIGWLVLMIFISPFLQLLTTIFSAFLTIARNLS